MSKEYDLNSKRDMNKFSEDLKNQAYDFAKKSAKSDTYAIDCPHCESEVNVPVGKSICPLCSKEIDLTLNFDF